MGVQRLFIKETNVHSERQPKTSMLLESPVSKDELEGNLDTHDEMLVLACSCTSSPFGLTVKILFSGTPTSL